ncbi:hypothetical protein IAU60_000402 [Kwoniella sp. DSM 27419]
MSSPPESSSVTASHTPTSSSRQYSQLTSTLSRLSQSTSGPTLPADQHQGFTGQTMKFGKEAWRRSGLGSLWKADEAESSIRKRSTGDSYSKHSTAGDEETVNAKLRSRAVDTSAILYPTLSIHPQPHPHNILVLSLAHISYALVTLSNEELFSVVLRRLEPWVGEEGEGGYILVILADEATEPGGQGRGKERRSLPGVAWWLWRWKRLPKKYRKNLKRLYIVRPSIFTRTLVPLIIPFISPKSYSKLHPLTSILSLYYDHRVPLKGIDLTLEAIEEEARILADRPELVPGPARSSPSIRGAVITRPKLDRQTSDASLAGWSYQALSSAVSTAASYLPLPQLGLGAQHAPSESSEKDHAGGDCARGCWGRALGDLMQESGTRPSRIPRLLDELRKAILAECTQTEGVFRRSSNSTLLTPLVACLDLPLDAQPNLPWVDIAHRDPLLPPKIVSRFLAELDEPVIGPVLYSTVRRTTTVDRIKESFVAILPPASAALLDYLTHMLHHLSHHVEATKMTPMNLAIVIAPVLISGPDPIQDTLMCLDPSKPVPAGLQSMAAKAATSAGVAEGQVVTDSGTVVGMLEMWIRDWPMVSQGAQGRCQCTWADGAER